MKQRVLTARTLVLMMLAFSLFGQWTAKDGFGPRLVDAINPLSFDGPPVAVAATGASTVMVPVSFTELAEKARAGVVNIRTVKNTKEGGPVFRHFFGRNPFRREDPFRSRSGQCQ